MLAFNAKKSSILIAEKHNGESAMAFQLDQVVPWGRSFDEYRRMFRLADSDLETRILGCADGPSSFNADGTTAGAKIVSADPIYCFTAEQIRSRVNAIYPTMIEKAHENRDSFVWTEFASVEAMGAVRLAAMNRFLEDYERESQSGRYVTAELPSLPFYDREFDVALCSHFLFLYSDHFDVEFHLQSILELGRVAQEVRIFPLLDLGGSRSPHVRDVVSAAGQHGLRIEIETVDYEFQRGGNEMMRVQHR